MSQKKIAVIGSGMAGLAAGWMCQKAGAEVTIFEARTQRGMDSHTQYLENKEGISGYVDVPLRVMSPHSWQTVLKVCETLDVETFDVDTQVACSWLNSKTWFRSNKLKFGSRMIPWAPLKYLLCSFSYELLKLWTRF